MYDPHATSSTFSATVTQYGGYRQPLDGSPSLNDGFGPSITVSQPQSTSPLSETLVDDFATLDTNKWTVLNNSTVTGGQLVQAGGELRGVNAYNLTGSTLAIQLVSASSSTGAESYFGLFFGAAVGSSPQLYWDVLNGTLSAQYYTGTPSTFYSTTFDPVAHAWLRLRESGGTIFFDTSPDGIAWTQRTSWVAQGDPGTVRGLIGGSVGGAGTTTWDNLNLAPSTAAGSISLSGGAAGAATVAAPGAVTLAGTGTATTSAAASGAVTLSGTPTPAALASGSGTVTLSGNVTATAPATAAGAVVLSGSSGASVAVAASGAVALSGSPTARGVASGSGAVTLSGAGAATAAGSSTGTVTITGTSAAGASPAAAGSITLSGTATGTIPGVNTAAGVVTLGGTATGWATATATGAISLSGAATTTAAVAATGAITLSGAGTSTAAVSSGGAVILGGAATAAVPATAAGLVFLSGLANGQVGSGLRDITLTVSAGRSRGLAAAGSSRGLTGTGRSRTAGVTAEQSRQLTATGASRTTTATPKE